MTDTITIKKEDAMKNFFESYSGDICSELKRMDREQLLDYLENDIFIGVASAVTRIPEGEFLEYAPIYFGV